MACDQIGGIECAAPHQGGDAAVAQHGAAVGEFDDLFQPMRHIDDGGALILQAAQHREQPGDLAIFQRGGRLVENEHAAAAAQRLGDGDDLLLGEAELPHRQIGVRRKVERRELRARLFAHPRAIDQRHAEQPPHRRIAQRQVLGDRQSRHELQLLRDSDDAGCDGVMRARQMAFPAADRHLPVVRPNDAAEDAHKRRFAGAILADQRVNLTRHHLETDAIKRRRRPEPFANVLGAGRYVIHAQPLSPELRDAYYGAAKAVNVRRIRGRALCRRSFANVRQRTG